MEAALRTYLLAQSSIVALVSTNVFWQVRNKKSGFPCVVLTLISSAPQHKYKGTDGLIKKSVQIDVYAENYGQAKTIFAEIKRSLSPQEFISNEVLERVFLTTERDLSSGDLTAEQIFRCNGDFAILYRE